VIHAGIGADFRERVIAATYATGTLMLAVQPTPGDTITLGDLTFTYVDTIPLAGEIPIGADVTETQTNTVSLVNQGIGATYAEAGLIAFVADVSTVVRGGDRHGGERHGDHERSRMARISLDRHRSVAGRMARIAGTSPHRVWRSQGQAPRRRCSALSPHRARMSSRSRIFLRLLPLMDVILSILIAEATSTHYGICGWPTRSERIIFRVGQDKHVFHPYCR
jgi:hypothetical protein